MKPKVFKLVTSLERHARDPGGVRIADAVRRAEKNLGTLRDGSRELIDGHLVQLRGLVQTRRPTGEELAQMRVLADDMLTFAAAAALPGMGEVLDRLCAMTDALSESGYWVAGALEPVMDALKLARAEVVPPEAMEPLVQGLDRCIERFSGHAVTH